MGLAAGLVLALLAAMALNVGYFFQHGATHTMVSLSLRHPIASARLLVTNRQWMLGYGAGWVGWGLYIAALSLAPLSLVQAVSAGGVGILAILAHQLGTPLTRQERIGTAVAVGGLVLLGLSLTSDVSPTAPAHSTTLVIVIAVGAGLAGGLVLLARRFRPGALLGCAAGLLFGVGDLATKGAVDGVGLLFIPILAACTALGFVTLQLAFQRGRVLETAGSSTLVNNLIPIVGGVVVFHEPIPAGAAGVARVASFVAVVVGAVLLASGRTTAPSGAHNPPLATHPRGDSSRRGVTSVGPAPPTSQSDCPNPSLKETEPRCVAFQSFRLKETRIPTSRHFQCSAHQALAARRSLVCRISGSNRTQERRGSGV